jgi:glycine hydroxymethyltransferase
LTTRGLVEEDICEIAKVIVAALGDGFEAEREELHERSRALTERYPLYPHLSSP